MVDIETREKILSDPSLPIHRHYRGFYNRKDILEMLLKGYTVTEASEELGVKWSTVMSAVKRLRSATGHEETSQMLRSLVIKHRGYL